MAKKYDHTKAEAAARLELAADAVALATDALAAGTHQDAAVWLLERVREEMESVARSLEGNEL